MSYSEKLPPKLWLEGLYLFRRHASEWAVWAVWFFAALMALQALTYDAAFDQAVAKLNTMVPTVQTQPNDEQMKLMNYILSHGMQKFGLMAVVYFIQSFFYTVFFMRKQAPAIGAPELSMGRFLAMLGASVQVFLISMGVALAIAVPVVVVAAVKGVDPDFVVVPMVIAVFYVWVKYILVVPLAVINIAPPLKTSWNMTNGNGWRIFGNMALFIAIVGGIVISITMIEQAVEMVAGGVPVAEDKISYVQIMFSSFNSCLISGLGVAFRCAILRVLYQEQRATGLTGRPAPSL